jgi:cyclomaltodextrinase / maltogenic alpha-amylase / neopullulanase
MGTPCIYYGDEVGMTGGQDPGCRKCMERDIEKQNRELFCHVQRLIELRREYPLLANEGKLSFVPPEYHDTCLAFTKSDGVKSIIVIVNTGDEEVEYLLPFDLSRKTVKNLWDNEEINFSGADLTIPLPSNGFAILNFYFFKISWRIIPCISR